MEERSNYYSINEVKKVVFNDKISRSLILKMIARNIIPVERYGGRILVPAKWVNKKIYEANNECHE